MSRFVYVLVAALALFALPACGGGGGGGGGGAFLPGTLTALAIQGQVAPGGGTYDAMDAEPVMDVARGGWAAFVAPVGGVDALFVAQPDGTVVKVFDTAVAPPGAPGTETIASFDCVWMCPDGTVIAYVTLQAGTAGFGLISAVVAGGVAGSPTGMAFHGQTPVGFNDTLQTIDVATGKLAECRLFILATDADPDDVLWAIDADGGSSVVYLETGQNIQAAPVTSIDGFGVSEDGALLGVAATVTTLSQIMAGTPTAAVSFSITAQIGDALFPGGTIADVYKNGSPILVYPNGVMLWVGFGPGLPTDEVMLQGDTGGGPPTQLWRTGDIARGTVSGTLTTIDMLQARVNVTSTPPLFRVGIVGDTGGITLSIFGLGQTGLFRYLYNGREWVTGVNWTATLHGISTGKYRDGGRAGSFAFRDNLTGGSSPTGMFWGFAADYTPLSVALENSLAPDGVNTFGSFATGAHTVAAGALIFRANLAPAGSGIFRQGP